MGGVCAQQSRASEYEWKANFLANTASFVEWPDESFPQGARTFRVCVFGSFSFGTSLAQSVRTLVVKGKHSEVKWIHREGELAACQIIFVSRSESKRYAKLVEATRTGRGLTVGETADFLDAGGMVSLLTDSPAPGFEVNLEAVNGAHLKLSPQMLALARRIVHPATVARS
jgi:hypothetical protein